MQKMQQRRTDPYNQDRNAISIPASYLDNAVRGRNVEVVDGKCYLEIPGFAGVWAQGETELEALAELRDVLVAWITLKAEHRDGDIPVLDGVNLNP